MTTSDMLDRTASVAVNGVAPLFVTRYTAPCRQCGQILALLDDEVLEPAPVCWPCDQHPGRSGNSS